VDRNAALAGEPQLEGPPDFGRSGDRCVALCRFVEAGADNPVLPGSAWLFENVLSPNLGVFGWVTIISEALVVILLVSGRYVRSAAVLGFVMSFSIGLAVANAENEWFWSYILMMVLHVAILVTTPAERPQSARTMSVVTIGYGVAVGINHLGAGLDGTGDWVLFSQQNDFPGELGRGSLPGSIAIAIGLVAIGIAGWFVAAGSTRLRTIVGWATVAVASALTLTYEPGGLIIGLSSRPGNMAILAALGLALAVTPALSGGRSTGGGASSPADEPG